MSKDGRTLLKLAAACSQPIILELLMDAKASPKVPPNLHRIDESQ